MAVVELNDENFKSEILENPGVSIVDFWAEWCGPCRMMGPIFEQASEEAAGKAKFGKLNVDDSKKTAGEFGVMSIPTLIIFKDGEKVEQMTGVQDKDTVVKKITEVASAKVVAEEKTEKKEDGEQPNEDKKDNKEENA